MAEWAQSGDSDKENRIAVYLSHTDPDVVGQACFQLGQLKARAHIPALLALLNHRDGRVVNMAGAGLRDMLDTRDAALAPRFEALLTHDFLLARISAIEALGRIHSTGSVPLLAGRLQSEDPAVQFHIVHVLGTLRSRQALPALEALEAEVRTKDMSSPHFDRARGTPAHPKLMLEAIALAMQQIQGKAP
ncbi:HEAT repeat domain-containing protein [Paracidovorax sp. MALMAid1276]|uniref:HEAT repeat domain-containing protein n=1 Tax=Paracidovorax sp. MALMAid1276 TaxID=3411631 RepID=UPI003B99F49D